MQKAYYERATYLVKGLNKEQHNQFIQCKNFTTERTNTDAFRKALDMLISYKAENRKLYEDLHKLEKEIQRLHNQLEEFRAFNDLIRERLIQPERTILTKPAQNHILCHSDTV